jgi:hypothetical protein
VQLHQQSTYIENQNRLVQISQVSAKNKFDAIQQTNLKSQKIFKLNSL